MEDLIKQLQQTEKPTQQLFYKIGYRVWGEDYHNLTDRSDPFWDLMNFFDDCVTSCAWEQAALILIPEGWEAVIDMCVSQRTSGLVECSLWHPEIKHDAGGFPYNEHYKGAAATAALAICIASLRVRLGDKEVSFLPDDEVVFPATNAYTSVHIRIFGDERTVCGRDTYSWVVSDDGTPAEQFESAHMCKSCKRNYL